MLRLFSIDRCLHQGIQALPPRPHFSRRLHLMDVDCVGALPLIADYLSSAQVRSEDMFITLRRQDGGLSRFFDKLSALSLGVSLDEFHKKLCQPMRWSSHDEWRGRFNQLASGKDITARQAVILRLLEKGWAAPRIASHLGISHKTLYTHLSRVKNRYGARTHAELMMCLRSLRTPVLPEHYRAIKVDEMTDSQVSNDRSFW